MCTVIFSWDTTGMNGQTDIFQDFEAEIVNLMKPQSMCKVWPQLTTWSLEIKYFALLTYGLLQGRSKNKKPHLGHSVMIIIGWDVIDRSLYILLRSYSSVCCLLSNLNFRLLTSVTYVYLCVRAPCVDESWQRMNETHAKKIWLKYHWWHHQNFKILKNNHDSLIAPPPNWGSFVLGFYWCNRLDFDLKEQFNVVSEKC